MYENENAINDFPKSYIFLAGNKTHNRVHALHM